jgi:hypothetical protein
MIDPMPFIALIDKAYEDCWHNALLDSRAWAKMFYAVTPVVFEPGQCPSIRSSVIVNVGHVADHTYYRIDQQIITDPDHKNYMPLPRRFNEVVSGGNYRYMIVHEEFCFGVDVAGPSRPLEITLVGNHAAFEKFVVLIQLDADSEDMIKSGY